MAIKAKAAAKRSSRTSGGAVRKAVKSAPARTGRVRAARRAAPSKPAAPAEPSTPVVPPATASAPRTEAEVVASKFRGAEERAPRPVLRFETGESRLQLLPRDPETLHVWWDLAPGLVEELKSRIGTRAFAVSTLTLRLVRDGGSVAVFHLGRRARSRYLTIGQGGSFTAEIGFTTPAGRFELVARSAPCFVPLGPARAALAGSKARVLGSYREGRALARRQAAQAEDHADAPHAAPSPRTAPASDASTQARPRRAVGGASDLYRR